MEISCENPVIAKKMGLRRLSQPHFLKLLVN